MDFALVARRADRLEDQPAALDALLAAESAVLSGGRRSDLASRYQ